MNRPLGPQTIKVVDLRVYGLKNAEIAKILDITEHAVREALRVFYRRTGIKNTLELYKLWNCEIFQIGLRELGLIR